MKKEDVLRQMSAALCTSFSKVKEEIEEHLQAINENTEEIQFAADHAHELEQKLNKLEERVDEIHLMLRQLVKQSRVSITLSKEEQKLFIILFTYDSFSDAKSLAQKAGIAEQHISEVVNSLADKGVPLIREQIHEMQLFKLESEFRDKQAREQIVKIDEDVKQQYQNQLLNQFFS